MMGLMIFLFLMLKLQGYHGKSIQVFLASYSLSKDGKPSYENSDIGFVTEAKYGIGNSKFNYAIDYDINLDGYKDIVIAVTRVDPYYVGKGLQVFLNTMILRQETESLFQVIICFQMKDL